MTITWKSLYDLTWLWLPLLVLGGVLLLKANVRIKDSLLKWLVLFFIFGWIVSQIMPPSEDRLHSILVDLAIRAYLMLMNVEMLWTQFHIPPTQAPVQQVKEAGQGENKQPVTKQTSMPVIPLTYQLRVLYCCTSVIFLTWLLLGLAFIKI